VNHPNARAGSAVRDILAPRDDESEIATVSLGERQLNPQHRQVLKLTRSGELAGIDRLEADICDNAQHGLLIGPVGTGDEHGGVALGEARLRHHIDAGAVECLEELGLARLTLQQLDARAVGADRKSGEARR